MIINKVKTLVLSVSTFFFASNINAQYSRFDAQRIVNYIYTHNNLVYYCGCCSHENPIILKRIEKVEVKKLISDSQNDNFIFVYFTLENKLIDKVLVDINNLHRLNADNRFISVCRELGMFCNPCSPPILENE